MKKEVYTKIKKIEELAPEMGGVFLTSDLKSIFRNQSPSNFFNLLKLLQNFGVISRFIKGVYIYEVFDPEMLSAKIEPDAYISMGTVLSKNGLIGSVPERLISAVKVARNRTYKNGELKIKHFGISQHLFFGFKKEGGIKRADNEKAYLDVLYYSMKGNKYLFNPVADVDLGQLDIEKCFRYLKKYKNKRFVSYCREILNG